MSEVVLTEEKSRDVRFRKYISTQFCPFRIKRMSDENGVQYEELMPCNPDCVALIHYADKTAYGCLRLIQVNCTSKTPEIFQGIVE